MGASRGNPLSPAFKLENLTGEMQPVHFDATVQVQIVPRIEWLDAHPPDADGKRPDCPPQEAEVVFILCAQAIFPSRIVVPAAWPRGEAPVGEILREPVTKVLALMQQADPELKEPIRALFASAEKGNVTP